MIVWGGFGDSGYLNTSRRSDPGYRQLDTYQHSQRARGTVSSHRHLEWQSNDCLGWI